MDDDVTIIQIIKGTDGGGARRRGLTEAQRTGRACLVCQGTDDLNRGVGWVNDIRVKVHSWHLGEYQLGETIPPKDAA
jgi:hypothetical protein